MVTSSSKKPVRSFYQAIGKRLFDFTAASAGILTLFAPMLAISILLRATTGKPVLFRQKRVGKDGKLFELVKFRTMKPGSEVGSSVTVGGDDRITPIGRLLRKSKLDELPQLLNIVKGEMSIVGPRPDVPGYADQLVGDSRRILDLRPGITGPATLAFRDEEDLLAAQDDPVKFNDEVIFPQKVKINLEYLEECSFRQDLGYIVKTLMPKLGNK